MPAPLLLDLSHTSHTRARTGIQRVARSIHAALGERALAVTHDPFAGRWRALEHWEQANLTATAAAPKRGARWPVGARIRGRAQRWFGGAMAVSPTVLADASGLIVPEIFSTAVAAALPALFARVASPRVAVFHDAIALRLPELTAAKTVARFPPYLRELLMFDGIAAVSEDSQQTLVDYWRWLGIANPPPVTAIPNGIDVPAHATQVARVAEAANLGSSPSSHVAEVADLGSPRSTTATTSPTSPVILCLGSIEGRKNHAALLDACGQLWARGTRFELHLIGLANAETGAAALTRIRALQSAGRALRYDGPVDDDGVTAAYARCSFTVYPSLMEGFGLPVVESLAHGKPCICSSRGALGEASRDGGCVTLDNVDAAALAGAIEGLLSNRLELERLSTAARARKFRTWSDYAADLTAWMATLPQRSA